MAVAPMIIIVRGTGSIGSRYLRILVKLDPSARLVAWPARPDRAVIIDERTIETITNADDIAHGRKEAWVIATDTGRHVDDALIAINRGATVLIEKPLASSVPAAGALLTAAGEQSVFVSSPLRFQAAMAEFRTLLPRIGDVHSVRIECQSYLPDWRPGADYRRGYAARADEGGVLRDLIHELDYARWLYGMPRTVFARLGSVGRLGIGAEEAADLWWQLDNGGSVSIRLDYLTRPARRHMVAAGSEGTLAWDALKQRVSLWSVDGTAEEFQLDEDRDAALTRQVLAFLQSADGGAASPILATMQDGLAALAVCDAARRSAETGTEEPVEVP